MSNIWISEKKLYDKWISCVNIDTLFDDTRDGYKLAIKTIEAAGPVMKLFGSGMIAMTGDIPCFLEFTVDVNENVSASLVVANDDDDSMHHLKCSGMHAKQLAAAFILDFPDANFLTRASETDLPKRLFLVTDKKTSSKPSKTSIMSFQTLRDLLEHGYEDFQVVVEK